MLCEKMANKLILSSYKEKNMLRSSFEPATFRIAKKEEISPLSAAAE